MKIYIKYILKNLLKYFVLILFILTMVVWITRTTRYIYYITDYGLSFVNFIVIIVNVLPNLLMLTLPISSFMSIIFSYNKLIKNNELIIFQNLGLKKINFLIPVFIFSFFVSILYYTITLYLLQLSNIKFEKIKLSMRNDAVKVLLNNTNFNSFQNITLYAKEKNNDILYSVFLYIKSNEKTNYDNIIYASSGKIVGTNIIFYNGNIQEFKKNESSLKTIFFDKYTIDISKYYDIDDAKVFDYDLMSLKELFQIKNNKIVNAEIANRLLSPILSITLSILACMLILNIKFSRNENNKSIIFIYSACIVVFALYLFFIKSAKNNNSYIYLCVLLLFSPAFYNLCNLFKRKLLTMRTKKYA